MVRVLILSHGPLADELLAAAKTINGGSADGIGALCLEWNVAPETALEQCRRARDELDGRHGLLVLTDMFGGTPHNVARQLAADGPVEILSGVNLPMVVRLCCSNRTELDLPELADWLLEKGRGSICRAPCDTPSDDCE